VTYFWLKSTSDSNVSAKYKFPVTVGFLYHGCSNQNRQTENILICLINHKWLQHLPVENVDAMLCGEKVLGLIELRFNISLDTKKVISEMFFLANLNAEI